MSLLADRRPWLHDLCRRADATALCWWRDPGGRTRLQIRRQGDTSVGVLPSDGLSDPVLTAVFGSLDPLREGAAWLSGLEATRLQIRRSILSDTPEEVGAALWADDGRGVEVLARPRPDPVPRPDLLAEIPEGLSRLVAGLSAHERLERTRTEPLPVLDGAPFAPLLSPPLGHRPAQILALRQGRDVALVEGGLPIPLFAVLP